MATMTLREVRYLRKRAALTAHIQKKIPGLKIIRKDKSFLMKLLSFFLFFNRRFMTEYVTTIYPNIYVPHWWGTGGAFRKGQELEILAHEYIHLCDRKRFGILFNILYLSPQIFSLLSILAFWNVWFLLCLLFLLPWPSPGRAWLEFRAYKVNLLVKYWILVSVDPPKEELCWKYINGEGLDWVLSQFKGPSYYFMFPFTGLLRKNFINGLKCVKINEDLSGELAELKQIAEK